MNRRDAENAEITRRTQGNGDTGYSGLVEIEDLENAELEGHAPHREGAVLEAGVDGGGAGFGIGSA